LGGSGRQGASKEISDCLVEEFNHSECPPKSIDQTSRFETTEHQEISLFLFHNLASTLVVIF
jgi:hypothetical protein